MISNSNNTTTCDPALLVTFLLYARVRARARACVCVCVCEREREREREGERERERERDNGQTDRQTDRVCVYVCGCGRDELGQYYDYVIIIFEFSMHTLLLIL